MKSTIYLALGGLLCCLFFSCGSEVNYKFRKQLNPNGIAPLTAMLYIDCDKPCSASITVQGNHPITQTFAGKAKKLEIPVVGLYPKTTNKVKLTVESDGATSEEIIEIKTASLPTSFPTIEINKLERSKMEPGFHGCDFHLANHGKFNSQPLIFDDEGIVRWYLDLSFNQGMAGPFQRIKNGNVLMAARTQIYEIDMLGKMVEKITLPQNYGAHHDLLELADGNLLIAVGKLDSKIKKGNEMIWSKNDAIILWDRKQKKIVREWDFTKHLDVDRNDINQFGPSDWIHMNGLTYLPSEKSIIVSNKNQGLAKVTWDDKLEWILAPKKNWGKAGRSGEGMDTQPYLLTAVDKSGSPYPNEVQLGDQSATDFDFSWGNHAPSVLPNGNLLVFDNGAMRNFLKKPSYSRAVEYQINATEKTVEQVWQYGKERGNDMFSSIISDTDYLPKTKNILLTSGFLKPMRQHSAKIVEVHPQTNEEVFEATMYFKTLSGNKRPGWGQMDILYRSERMDLSF